MPIFQLPTINIHIMIRIVIADDHTIMREGLKRILEGADDIEVVGEAVDGFEVLAQVRKGGFDLLLLDLSMPGRSGVELIRQIKDEVPKLPILILTMHEEEQYAVRAIRAGARGYLTKESAGTQLVSAIRKVASGRPYISLEVAEQLAMDVMPSVENLPHKQLSDREFEVFSLLVGGKSITEIAELLHLSVKTVSTHKTRILHKMGMPSLADLVQYAVAHRLLTPFRM
jgi:DNA-binding NarL/FixJ family response regulator